MTIHPLCACQTIVFKGKDSLIKEFGLLRDKCSALREFLIPENIWPNFQQAASDRTDEARHRFNVIGAFQNGLLSKITLPIHQYLLDGQKPKKNVITAYKKELIEKWMFEETAIERHRKERIFQGKLAELKSAVWLEHQGWTIENLEAIGGCFDIEANSPSNLSCAIEVKYIGQEDIRFKEIVKSLSNGQSFTGRWCPDDGYNYLLSRVYEAAKQLSKSDKERFVFIIISNMAWDFLSVSINVKGLISKRPLKFLDNTSEVWKGHLEKLITQDKLSNIKNDLDKIIGNIKEFRIIRENQDLSYSLEKTVHC